MGARAEKGEVGGADRGHAGGGGEALAAALQLSDALLEGGGGGVAEPGVFVPIIGAAEAGRADGGALEGKGGGLVDGHADAAEQFVGVLSRVDALRVDAGLLLLFHVILLSMDQGDFRAILGRPRGKVQTDRGPARPTPILAPRSEREEFRSSQPPRQGPEAPGPLWSACRTRRVQLAARPLRGPSRPCVPSANAGFRLESALSPPAPGPTGPTVRLPRSRPALILDQGDGLAHPRHQEHSGPAPDLSSQRETGSRLSREPVSIGATGLEPATT